MHDNMPLSEKTQAIILGSLLGDGSLKIHKPYKNARFAFRHSMKQEEYFRWKANALKEISAARDTFRQEGLDGRDGWGGPKLRYQSAALPALTDLYHLVHKRGQFRIKRKWLNRLTPLSLAIWWCDDGSLVSDSRQGVFCTDGFAREDVELLANYLKVVWGITSKIGRVHRPDSKYEQYRIWIRSTVELQKFLRIIIPHIPVPSMLAKTMLLYRDPILQQRWISEVVSLSSFSEETVKAVYEEKKSKRKDYR